MGRSDAPHSTLLVKPKTAPLTPSALTIAEALSESAPLARLKASLADSNARFDHIRTVRPAALR